MLYFSVKSLSDTQNKNNSKTQTKLSRETFCINLFLQEIDFLLFFQNRTSDYTRATRGLFIISFIKVKEPP